MSKRKRKRRKKKPPPFPDKFFIIEGQKLNEKTGVMEPYKKIVYWGQGC